MRITALALLLALSASAGELPALDVRFKTRGYFLARTAQPLERPIRRGQVSLVARPERAMTFEKYQGFRVLLVNETRADVTFASEDGRLNVVREARDAAGRWRPIEYLPHSWCGNSYYALSLPAGQFWSFRAPAYGGTFHTRMRFVLEQEGLRLVSNEFEGTINPEQFDKKQGHTPNGLMDPYDD